MQVRVVSMFVVCTHPDNGAEAFVDTVPNMDVEAALAPQPYGTICLRVSPRTLPTSASPKPA